MGQKKLLVKLVRSVFGRKPSQRFTIRALGLRKPGQVVEHEDTPQIRGMISKVYHLVSVKELEE